MIENLLKIGHSRAPNQELARNTNCRWVVPPILGVSDIFEINLGVKTIAVNLLVCDSRVPNWNETECANHIHYLTVYIT